MKFSVLQESLVKGLGYAIKALDRKTSVPVLLNVFIEAKDARLQLCVTDFEQTINVWVGAKVEQEGAITLPVKTLLDFVKGFPKERVDFTLNTETLAVHIKCGISEINLNGVSADEFPMGNVREEDRQSDAIVPAGAFKHFLKKTLFAVAREDNRPILTGVNFEFEKSKGKNHDKKFMHMITADGYRGVWTKIELNDPDLALKGEYTIPAKGLKILQDIIDLKEDDIVKIWWDKNRDQMTFGLRSIQIRIAALEGKFPDFQAIVPRSWTTSMTVNRADVLTLMTRAAVFAKDNANSVKMEWLRSKGNGETGKLHVTAKSMERGVFEGTIDASVEGDYMETSVNVAYVIDLLKAVEEKGVTDDLMVFETNGSDTPIKVWQKNSGFVYAGKTEWLTLVMPMSTGR